MLYGAPPAMTKKPAQLGRPAAVVGIDDFPTLDREVGDPAAWHAA
jgi:hypothetical protein